jgi:hypothetical protein
MMPATSAQCKDDEGRLSLHQASLKRAHHGIFDAVLVADFPKQLGGDWHQ